MRTEVVIFDDASPVCVYHAWALLIRTNPVHPVICIGKAATGPAQYGYLYFAQSIDYIVPQSVGIRYGRFFSNPYASVDSSPEMLRKMPVNVFVNSPNLSACI